NICTKSLRIVKSHASALNIFNFCLTGKLLFKLYVKIHNCLAKKHKQKTQAIVFQLIQHHPNLLSRDWDIQAHITHDLIETITYLTHNK
ncbi:hypothetical protein, partial [uncultured Duncaniella sp.]